MAKEGRGATKPPFSKEALRLGQRIREARGDEPQPRLAQRIEVSQQSLSSIENGLTNPDDPRARRTLQRLAAALGSDFGRVELRDYAGRRETKIRIEGRVAAGQPIEFYETDENITIDRDFIHASGELTALRVSGESMLSNHILSGDILICRRDAAPRRHAITVVELKGERGSTVKRWERRGDDITLCADFGDPAAERQHVKAWFIGKAFEVVGLVRAIQ